MLTPVSTPFSDAWILADDEAAFRAEPGPAAPARLLPSGDAFYSLGEPIERSSCPRPGCGPSYGRHAYGPARSSWVGTSSACGAGRRPRSRSTPGAAFPRRNARLLRLRRSRFRWISTVQSRSSGAEDGVGLLDRHVRRPLLSRLKHPAYRRGVHSDDSRLEEHPSDRMTQDVVREPRQCARE